LATEAIRYDADFLLLNKRFYLEEEDNDLVAITDRLKGLESLFHRGRQRLLKRLIARYGASPYVDAGCGTGLGLRHLPSGSTGLDINPRNMQKARQNAPLANVLQGDIENMPIRPGSVATVILTEVLEHFPNPADVVAHMHALLRPGGRLIGTVPSHSPLWNLRFLSRSSAGEPYHDNYSKDELRAVLNGRFAAVDLGASNSSMSLYFVATKDAAPIAHPRELTAALR